MGDEAWDPALRPLYDVGTEPSITLVGRSRARTSAENDSANPSQGGSDQAGYASLRSTVAGTVRWKRLTARVIHKRREDDGTWQCEVCNGTISYRSEIDIDLVKPVSQGGELCAESDLRVAHRRCNRRQRRQTEAARRQRPMSSEEERSAKEACKTDCVAG